MGWGKPTKLKGKDTRKVPVRQLTSAGVKGVRSCWLSDSFVNLVARYSSRVVSSCGRGESDERRSGSTRGSSARAGGHLSRGTASHGVSVRVRDR